MTLFKRTVVDGQIKRFFVFIILMCSIGCDSLTKLSGPVSLPNGTYDPHTFQNEAGALAFYRGAVAEFELVDTGTVSSNFSGFLGSIYLSGLISDELHDPGLGGSIWDYFGGGGAGAFSIDARHITSDVEVATVALLYNRLQKVRGAVSHGIGMLQKYAPNLSPALRGHLYAVAGYAELLLADIFCSGVPLSTLDFEKDFTYKPGSSTTDIYDHANALFDTALNLSSDSLRIMNLARVGKARTLLNLGRWSEAHEIAQSVSSDFSYQFDVPWGRWRLGGNLSAFGLGPVSNREGGTGIEWIDSHDPRTITLYATNNKFGYPLYIAQKYGTTTAPVIVADGIEARLISAEAVLNMNDSDPAWLEILNSLRTSGFALIETDGAQDTIWNPGLGGVAGLNRLTDPGTAPLPPGKTARDVRVDLLFRERAAWLFLTAHRQGDLRRLIRLYGRRAQDVFPSGAYSAVYSSYGTVVSLPVPQTERVNPLFTGCFNQNR